MNRITTPLLAFFLCIILILTSCDLSTAEIAPTATSKNTSINIPTSSPPPYTPPDHRIGIRVINGVGEFYDRNTDEKFVPRGMNYIHIGPQYDAYGQSSLYHNVFDPGKYDPDKIGVALTRMHTDGYNVVRVFLSQNTIGTKDDGLSPEYMQNVSDFLERAKQNHVYVMFTQDWIPAGKYDPIISRDCCSNFNLMNLNYLSSSGLRANVEFFKDLVQSLFDLRAPTDAIFSFELRNELFYETDQPPLSLIKGKVTTANGKIYDMSSSQDKQKIVEDNLVYWIDSVRTAILNKDPTALVSVGFFQPQEPNPSQVGDPRLSVTEPAIWQSKADFIDLHVYPGIELDLQKYVKNFGINDMQEKPIIMGEFGAKASRFITVDNAVQRLVKWQVESCQYGFDGWLFWTWDNNENPDFFNALSEDGKIEKALSVYTRPDACSAGTGTNSPMNLALNAKVIASHALPDQLAKNAVDGSIETQWNSGHEPKQWIEVDLGRTHSITSLRLTIAQETRGSTIHQVWVRGETGYLHMIYEFNGVTTDHQTLEYIPNFALANVQVIRILTTQSPALVSWREIEVFGK